MRRAAVAGVVLLALVGGFLVWKRGPGAPARASQGGGLPEVAPRAAETIALTDEPTDPTDEATDDGTVDIAGTVVVAEGDGRLVPNETGTLWIRTEGVGTPEEVEVVRGAWRAKVPPAVPVLFSGIVLGGRKAIPEREILDVPADGAVEVRCRWFVPARLRVIGEKGEDLDGVELIKDMTPWASIAPAWSPQIANLAGRSPVEIPVETEGPHTYWVRAKDHAWARLTIFQGFGGERVVRLVRGGTLKARFVPFDPDAGVCLHLYRSSEHALEWWPDDSGLARIESLPPGEFELRAYFGRRSKSPPLASAGVEIEALETTDVSLSLHNAPTPPEPVPLEGALHVDPAWPLAEEPQGFCGGRTIDIQADGELDWGPRIDLEDDGRWSAGVVRPGRYCFTVEPWMWVQVIEVGLRGTTEARLSVPPPCEVEVRLVDAETGDAVPADGVVSWCVKAAPGGDEFYYEKNRQACAQAGVWRFDAPVGTLEVGYWDDFRDAETIEVGLRPGKNRVELRAVPNFACDLALKDGPVPVPVDKEFSDGVRAVAMGGDGELEECGTGFPCRIWFKKPGRYRLSFAVAIEGYQPVEPVEVQIAAGTLPRIEVPLKAGH